jgi:hypothetical protein
VEIEAFPETMYLSLWSTSDNSGPYTSYARLTVTGTTEAWLGRLRELYATDQLTLDQLEATVWQALNGEPPDLGDGLPLLPDPRLVCWYEA